MRQGRRKRRHGTYLLLEDIGNAADLDKLNFGFIGACLEKWLMKMPGGSVEHWLLAGHEQRWTTDTNANNYTVVRNVSYGISVTDNRTTMNYKTYRCRRENAYSCVSNRKLSAFISPLRSRYLHIPYVMHFFTFYLTSNDLDIQRVLTHKKLQWFYFILRLLNDMTLKSLFRCINNRQLSRFPLGLKRRDLKAFDSLFTGHTTLYRHLTIMKIRTDPLCPVWGEEEKAPYHF